MRRVRKQLLLSPFSPPPAASRPVLPSQQAQRAKWELLQGGRAAFAKRREGVNSCMRERRVRSAPNGEDWVCVPWGKECTWKRLVRYRKIYSQPRDLRWSHKPIKLPSQSTQVPAILSHPSLLSQNSPIFLFCCMI